MSEFTTGTVKDLRYLYENVVHGEQEVLNEIGVNLGGQQAVDAVKARSTQQQQSTSQLDDARARRFGAGSYRTAGPAEKPRIASLPANAKQVMQYPQGVSTGVGGGNAGASRSTPTPRPAASVPTSRPSAPSTTAPGSPARALPPNAKATAPAAKPAGSAMDQWAKANPKLAAASAERARIRGTAQTDNPLMKDMKSSLPMNSPSVQAPAVAKLGAGNQSLSQNQNAFKAAPVKPATPAATPSLGQRAATMTSPGSSQYKATTPSAAIAAAPSASPAASGSVVPATDKIAAMKQQPEVKPQAIAASYEYDAYDLVLEYLLDDGHAATIAEAEYIMTELDSEVINQIVETRLDPRGRPASGPMNVYANPKGKPDQAHLDAVKAYDEKQKKKTPEQRKKELDAYIARQRNK